MACAQGEGMTHINRALTIVPPAYTLTEDTTHARELLQEEICRLLHAAGVTPMRRRNVPMYALDMQRRAILDGYLLPDARLFVLPDSVAVHQEPLRYSTVPPAPAVSAPPRAPQRPSHRAPRSPVTGRYAANEESLGEGVPKALSSSPPQNEGPRPMPVAHAPRHAKARTRWAVCS